MEILSLGEKLKRKRKELNMTLKDLAGDRITPGQISLVESGKSNPSMDLLEYLADTLNISMEYLMESEETQAEKICSYFENMAEAYTLNEEFPLAQEYMEKSFYYAEKYNLEYRKAKSLFLKAVIYEKCSNLTLAQQFFLSANVTFIKENSFEDIVNTFLRLGIISLNGKSYNSAINYFKQSEKVFVDNRIGNDFLFGAICYYLAFTYHKLDDKEGTAAYAFIAKEKFNQLENKKTYAQSLLYEAKNYNESGDMNRAISYSNKSLKIFKYIDNYSFTSEIENNLGKLFYEFENFEESFLHLNKSRRLREANKDLKLVETLMNICEAYIKLKDVYNAKLVLQDIINNIDIEDKKTLIDYYILKYRFHILDGDLKEAENTLVMALEFAENVNYKKEQAELAIILGKFYTDNGQAKKADKYLESGVEFFKSLGII